MFRWMDEKMDGWMDGGWIDGWMDGRWTNQWMEDGGMDGWRMDQWIEGWMTKWMDGWMEGWMEDGWRMDEGMDGVSKNIKIGDYILYAKKIMKVEGQKHIQEKDENWGYFFC